MAPVAGESGRADAREGGDGVDARGIVLARRRLALVDVDIAVLAGETRGAHALVTVDQIVTLINPKRDVIHRNIQTYQTIALTSAVVVARMGEALVELQVAVISGESGPTVALVRADRVLTDAVDARLQDAALVHVTLAVAAGESFGARARVVAHGVDARPTVLARVVHAVVDVVQAQRSGES